MTCTIFRMPLHSETKPAVFNLNGFDNPIGCPSSNSAALEFGDGLMMNAVYHGFIDTNRPMQNGSVDKCDTMMSLAGGGA